MIVKKICFLTCLLGITIGDSTINLQVLFAGCISIFIGMLLKLNREWSKGPLNMKKVVLQMIFSFGLGYFAFLYVIDKDWFGIYKQLFLGGVSFASGEIIVAIEEVSKGGIKTYLKNKINTFLAKKDDDN